MEHFVTLLDGKFVPQCLSLHASLLDQKEQFTLWIVCVDLPAYDSLSKTDLQSVRLVDPEAMESKYPELRELKATRSRVEYCWTLTPFSVDFVMSQQVVKSRVTYIDADIYFFGSASRLLGQMDEAAHVLVTEHARAPEYSASRSGRFCVQFVAFRKSVEAQKICDWWRAKCTEWCFARFEDQRFGDQKYLEAWPRLFAPHVGVLQDVSLALAPWNIDHLCYGELPQGFYHFQGFRLFENGVVRLWRQFGVSERTRALVYEPYLRRLSGSLSYLCSKGVTVELPYASPALPDPSIIQRNRFGALEAWVNLHHDLATRNASQ